MTDSISICSRRAATALALLSFGLAFAFVLALAFNLRYGTFSINVHVT